MRFCSSTSGLLKLVAETPRFRSSRICESTRDLRGQTTRIIAWRGYEYPLKERYLQTAGNNWNIIHFACPVNKMVNTSFRLRAANKGFFCCSALIKYQGQNFFEYSFRNNIHVKISKHGEPLRTLVPYKGYCECSIQTISFPGRERRNLPSEMRCENPQRPLGSYN